MKILVCIKRVPSPGSRINLTSDEQHVDATNLGFTMSPHEECAIEEGILMREKFGGSVTILTVGPADAVQQLRQGLARGADDAILIKTDELDVDPFATADAISKAIADMQFDLILFGNESADSGGFQVGVRVARSLDIPFISAIKKIDIDNNVLEAHRESDDGMEVYQMKLPAAVGVKEGINLPRLPTMKGRIMASRSPVSEIVPDLNKKGPFKVRLKQPDEEESKVEVLGTGEEAVDRVMQILAELKVIEDKAR